MLGQPEQRCPGAWPSLAQRGARVGGREAAVPCLQVVASRGDGGVDDGGQDGVVHIVNLDNLRYARPSRRQASVSVSTAAPKTGIQLRKQAHRLRASHEARPKFLALAAAMAAMMLTRDCWQVYPLIFWSLQGKRRAV